MSTTSPLSPSIADSRALPPGVPPHALAHLGITPEHVAALDVLKITLVEAVAHGIITLPPPLTLEALPGYLETVREWVEMGLDPNESPDEKFIPLDQAITEGLLTEP